ncbi:MAG: hypothetical protein JWP69_1362 [Flaviaesturariibacter sp.]|nr:hypothetical protein [Flaviaesturariibacter sp.]
METNVPASNNTRAGTLSGTLLVLIVQINTSELLKTALLACTGATVSFLVTLVLKCVQRWLK